ncbi:hypothetical protein [Actinomadura flavalba]|uniref:hypothetical protein n=1 Tax=Actinomadura flavalba TaxID=1120938 RepID=UPI00037A62E1|nr:hypothetical protein [Actinomadura flavalba]
MALSIDFEWMAGRGAARGRMTHLAKDLSSLPGCRKLPEILTENEFAKRPSLLRAALSGPKAKYVVLHALDRFLTAKGDL